MATLKDEDIEKMTQQIRKSEGVLVPKQHVLFILHNKLKELDKKNQSVVDRIDGAALKDVIEKVYNLK